MQELQRIQFSLMKPTKPIVPPIVTNLDTRSLHDQSNAPAMSPSPQPSPVDAACEMPFGSVGPANENLGYDTGRELIDPN